MSLANVMADPLQNLQLSQLETLAMCAPTQRNKLQDISIIFKTHQDALAGWHSKSCSHPSCQIARLDILQHALLSQTLQPAASKIPWEAAMVFAAKSNALHPFLKEMQ